MSKKFTIYEGMILTATILFVIFILCKALTAQSPIEFVRGDANQDGIVDVDDAIFIANYNGLALCEDSLDVDDNGIISNSDAYMIVDLINGVITYLPPPWPFCGTDPTQDDLDCFDYDVGPHRGEYCVPVVDEIFSRGDADMDGNRDLADVTLILNQINNSWPIICPDASDCDDNGFIQQADAQLLMYLIFQNASLELRSPFPGCGVDEREDSLPNCLSPSCPY